MPGAFEAVFSRLRELLYKHSTTLPVLFDNPDCYGLGGFSPKLGKPMPVAWVQTGKAYVSFHLMPVYGCAKLRDGMSKELKRRMQGKSCFNFKAVDEALFAELADLTARGIEVFRKAGYLPDKGSIAAAPGKSGRTLKGRT